MKDSTFTFCFVLCFILFASFIFLCVAIKSSRVIEIRETRVQLRIIAETTLTNSESWEPVISEDKYIGPDIWGTEIRLLYVKLPDISIVVATSAGPNCVWNQDDIFEAVFIPSNIESDPQER